MATILICVVVFILAYISIQWLKAKSKTPLPPGPSFLESLKLTWRLIKHNDLHLVSTDLAKRFGDIHRINIFGENLVVLSSSRVIRKVLASGQYREVSNDRPPSFFKKYIFFDGHDIFFRDYGETLAKLRRIVHGAIQLYGEGVKSFEDRVNDEIGKLQDQLRASVGQSSVDLDHALTRSLIRVIFLFLTDELPENTEYIVNVVAEHDRYLNMMFRFSHNTVLSVFPWVRHVPGLYSRLYNGTIKTQNQILDIFLNPDIKERMKKKNKGIMGKFLAEAENDEEIDDLCIKGVLSDLVGAGFVTTKGALSGFFLLMLYYPEVQLRIQQEIDENIGRDRAPSLEDRSVLHYTYAAILECLRFIGHTPLGVPHQTRGEIVVDGVRIPARTIMITNWWSMTHDEKTWGDPNTFRPERFLDEEGQLLSVDHPVRTQLISFGIGRRVCLGESFAKSRIFLYVTSLLQRFKFLPGENELANLDPTTWENNSVIQPGFLRCVVESR